MGRVWDDFSDIMKPSEPLAPYTYLKVGGPAEGLAHPRSVDELTRLIQRCQQEKIPWRVLGGGCNVLVADEGVPGLVLRLHEPAFSQISTSQHTVRAGAGAAFSAVISEAARHALAGLESLIGIPGTVAGALRSGAGLRSGDLSRVLRHVEIMDRTGQVHRRDRGDLDLGAAADAFDDTIILAVELELEPDDINSILKRMRKFWIQRKAQQPLSFQASGKIFRDPRGQTADQLIEQAGLKGMRVGGAEISDRNANFIIAHPGTTARDVHRLIDVVRSQVSEQTGQRLELDIFVWP